MEKRVIGIILTILGVAGLLYAAAAVMKSTGSTYSIKTVAVYGLLGLVFFSAGIGLVRNTKRPGSLITFFSIFLFFVYSTLQQLTENIDYYFDANGYMVLTEKYLQDRGTCCGNGCRHCPYQYRNVPEPRRTQLLQHRSTHHP